jgi:hypothetical protein
MKINRIVLSIFLCISIVVINVCTSNPFTEKSSDLQAMEKRHRQESRELNERQQQEKQELRKKERQQSKEMRDGKREKAYADLKTLFFNALDKDKNFTGNVSISISIFIRRGKRKQILEYTNNKGTVTRKGFKKNENLKKTIEKMFKLDTNFSGIGKMTFLLEENKKSCVRATYENKDGSVFIKYSVSTGSNNFRLNLNEYSSTRGWRAYWRASRHWMGSWFK